MKLIRGIAIPVRRPDPHAPKGTNRHRPADGAVEIAKKQVDRPLPVCAIDLAEELLFEARPVLFDERLVERRLDVEVLEGGTEIVVEANDVVPEVDQRQ